MALKKAKKAELIDSYTDALKASKSAVYVKFRGLPVKETMELRDALFTENIHYTVVKKTLWTRATEAVGIKGDVPVVGEELAVVWGDDLLSPARLSYEFGKTHKDTFVILGGIFDGEYKDAKAMMKLREKIEENGKLSIVDEKTYNELKKKYGISEESYGLD